MRQKTLMNILGITFILMGIVFLVLGGLMVLMMGAVSNIVSAFSAFGGAGLGQLNTLLLLGWVFSIVTVIAGAFCIISSICLFVSKDE